ncbi:MAG: adenylyltransferase/cytidyltransferase family protein [Candidatus Neomarinimicrobiota bacterium]
MLDEKKIFDHVASIRKTNKKIVFTNGCFDLLHKGHRDLIKQSFSFGDILIVGLNSDESVKRLKGEYRPMQNEIERKNALLNTGYVNEVYIFDDDTPLELINLIKPDILVKGGDYTPNEIVGFEEVTSSGGEIKIVQLTPGFSTTSTIENMR